jgi:hypothetical protein
MVVLSKEPPEKDEDDLEPDIVPDSRKNQLCHSRKQMKFRADLVAVAEKLGDWCHLCCRGRETRRFGVAA